MGFPPTFEQYQKATAFARFRYKYGLIVQLVGVALLILLLFFVWYYGEEMASHPLSYAARHYTIPGALGECTCTQGGIQVAWSNGTHIEQQQTLTNELNTIKIEVNNGSVGGIRSTRETE